MNTTPPDEQLVSMHVDEVEGGPFGGRYLLDSLLHPIDARSQLAAIWNVIGNHRAAESIQDNVIDDLAVDANAMPDAELSYEMAGLRNDLIGKSFFDGAARSMATVGVIAPFLETVYCRFFAGLGSMPEEVHLISKDHGRAQMAVKDRWDCHFTVQDGKIKTDLVLGIHELSEVTRLAAYLPVDAPLVLSTLIKYRNAMFHNGLEWPVGKRESFRRYLGDSKVPEGWFDISTCGDESWIFYMSAVFVDHCLETAAAILDGMGRFLAMGCRDRACLAWWTERM